jgi:hypothetical protein
MERNKPIIGEHYLAIALDERFIEEAVRELLSENH